MLFSSPRFFVFLAATLVALWVVRGVDRKKNVLALASCLFYAAWDYRYLGLLLAVSVIDYLCAAKIATLPSGTARRGWLVASVASNLLILAYFKYTNFFIGTWNGILGSVVSFRAMHILLPAGISFYTFKSMSYTIDVYRREIEPCRSHLDYVTFVTFFPELIAGPIVRASVFLPQMNRDIGLTGDRLRAGASLFLLGLFKKLVIADRMATIADPVFANPDRFDTVTTWLGVLAYAIQIYTDFSGYSDMAIGTAKLIGYDLPENFDMPYAAPNITVFWRRWHITLSTWLRDYLYIPLGGNRKGPMLTYVNLAATMLLGGLWHGASWNFVVWGGLHGVALSLHRLLTRGGRTLCPAWAGIPATFLFVMLAWIPFRATTFGHTARILRTMFAGSGGAHFVHEAFLWCVPLLIVAHVLGEVVLKSRGVRSRGDRVIARLDLARVADPLSGPFFVVRGTAVAGAIVFITAVLTIFFFAEVSASPFIYFQF
jgi:alginate O-acetyltransferase complex protein AlgI